MKLLRDIERFQGGFTLVRYQARGALTNWHCFPISFKKEENEFFTDLRKLSKCSVSYLVAIAAEQYLNELLNEGANRHNYAEFTAYAIGKRIERDVVCWEFYWGNPGDIPIRHSTTRIHRCIKDSSAGR
jgi:hypothetical protein